MQSNEIENAWVKKFLGKYILVRSNMAGVFVEYFLILGHKVIYLSLRILEESEDGLVQLTVQTYL